MGDDSIAGGRWAWWVGLATLTLACLLLASGPAAAATETVDQFRFERNITAPGGAEPVSHNASTGENAYPPVPEGADRVQISVEWADGGLDPLRVTVYEGGGCVVDCPYREPWNETGASPVSLTFEAPDADDLSIDVSTSEGPQAQRTVVGEVVFLAEQAPPSDPDAEGSEEPIEQASATSRPDPGPSGLRVGAGLAVVTALGAAVWRVRVAVYDRWRWLAPLWSLFSRQEKGDLLDHPLRRRTVEAVERRPGIHLEALVRELDAGRGQLDRHLAKLVGADLLVEEIAHGYRAYFRPGDVRPEVRQALLVLKTDGARRIVESLADAPQGGVRAIARETGLAPSTVSYHLHRLEDHGLVLERSSDGTPAYVASALARRALGRLPD